MRKILFLIIFLLVTVHNGNATIFLLKSPDGKLKIEVEVGQTVSYQVHVDGKEIISPSRIGLNIDGENYTAGGPRVKDHRQSSISEEIKMIVPRKYSTIRDEYNELVISFGRGYNLLFRAYDEGAAYRWQLNREGEVKVFSEEVNFSFPADHKIWFPEEISFYTHQEREYFYLNLSEITPEKFCSTGTLVELPEGYKVFISEADLFDYPGLYLEGSRESPYGLHGRFPAYPLDVKQTSDRDVEVVQHAGYIANTDGTRSFPWRVVLVSREDAALVESELIYKLSSPLALEDVSWIRPGKVAWDWWNSLNLYGVDFETGVNTRTYKYLIDFAADHKLEYIIMDEGWYELEDPLKLNDELDMNKVLSHAKNRQVGIILWVTWKVLDDRLEETLDQFAEWGVAGIKVDFMQRDDQWMVGYYHRVAREASKRRLLVDFHGSYKPTGLRRAYPNVITREGLKGLENNKWDEKANPEHDLILPFTRMVSGPMDYTPGAMQNATRDNFVVVFDEPMSQGTRCHQLAMYVVYESPLQMLADSPSNYEKEPETMEFLSEVPTVWDDTRVINAKAGDYIMVARKRGNEWYIGAMTDWESRDMELELSFLEEGSYRMIIYEDGVNAHRVAKDYRVERTVVGPQTKLNINMAPGGGWAARIIPE